MSIVGYQKKIQTIHHGRLEETPSRLPQK